MLQPELIEIKLGKTTNIFNEFTALKPRFIETTTTTFNTYILLGEGLYLAIISYNVSIFLPKRHSVFLLGITSSCLAFFFFLAPASCLSLHLSTKVGRGQGSPILPPSASYYSQIGPVISAWMIRCLFLRDFKICSGDRKREGFQRLDSSHWFLWLSQWCLDHITLPIRLLPCSMNYDPLLQVVHGSLHPRPIIPASYQF